MKATRKRHSAEFKAKAAVEEALARFGGPEIFNTDQGSQFASFAFASVLHDAEVRISMDGRGRWMDNVFSERLWCSLKYEYVYLNAFETGSELRAGLGRWIIYYNTQRPPSGLAGKTLIEAYRRIGASHKPFDYHLNGFLSEPIASSRVHFMGCVLNFKSGVILRRCRTEG